MAAAQDQHETIITLESAQLRYGPGAVDDVAYELGRLEAKSIFLVADPMLRSFGVTERVTGLIEASGIKVTLFEDIHVEPTTDSLASAAAAATEAEVDAFVALGGGSTIDTAKVANLIKRHGGEVMDYVNPPIGGGRKPPSALFPLVAIPTTSGTGSEATTVAVLDIPHLKLKSGISHRFMRPTVAIVDPELSRTTPQGVTASAGLDVICHAAESYTNRRFDSRPKPKTPDERPPYQGSNPIADIWSMKALEFGGLFLERAVADGHDVEARGTMMLAATMAGIGFGTAGVHIPHACAYPIAGLKHVYHAPGYSRNHAFVPHGFSVIVTAPAASRFTFERNPEKHLEAARLLSGGGGLAEPGPESLPNVLIAMMKAVGAPRGIAELGYGEADIPALVDGALKQQRLLSLSPRPTEAHDLEQIFRASMANW
jgi:alcohol dehydrogenase class IV